MVFVSAVFYASQEESRLAGLSGSNQNTQAGSRFLLPGEHELRGRRGMEGCRGRIWSQGHD